MIYIYCPDYNLPSGGIRKLYRHADILNRNGFAAVLVHGQPGFRCSWFANETAVTNIHAVRPGPKDFIVLPEIYGPDAVRLAPGIRKVIFNQNCYNTFAQYPIGTGHLETPYHHPDIVAALTVSEDSAAYLRFAFPKLNIMRLHLGLDTALFRAGEPKRRQIAFMPRKQLEDAKQVFNILRFRGVLEGFEIAEITDVPQDRAAAILRQSGLFFSFSGMEGFGLPPAEAMASGCVTAGYHGWGGAEFFKPDFSWPVAFGDIQAYARTAEALLTQYRHDPAPLLAKAAEARAFICAHYSDAIEEADIVACWQKITQG